MDRRDLLKKSASTVAALTSATGAVSARRGRRTKGPEGVSSEASKILYETNDPEKAIEYLNKNGFNTEFNRVQGLQPSPVYLRDSSLNNDRLTKVRDGVTAQEAGIEHKEGEFTSYALKSNLELIYGLSKSQDSDYYEAWLFWKWGQNTLGPKDVVAVTYKENSWRVPPNGYSSGPEVELSAEDRSANGYAWKHSDSSHNTSNGGNWTHVSLEVEPYDENISSDVRDVWFTYASNYSVYPGWIKGIALGYGYLSVTTSIKVTTDTWIEDNNGNEMKISQADATGG